MSAQVGPVLFDTNTLVNFAVIDRLDLLNSHYGHRAIWTETVEIELRRGLRAEPKIRDILDANWLGDPIEIAGTPDDLEQVDRIRRALGGTAANPMQHLGEAEIISYIQNRAPGAISSLMTCRPLTLRGVNSCLRSIRQQFLVSVTRTLRSAARTRTTCLLKCEARGAVCESLRTTLRSVDPPAAGGHPVA